MLDKPALPVAWLSDPCAATYPAMSFPNAPVVQPLSWLAAHWETLLLVVLLGGAGLWVFRSTLAVYGHIFFPARAVRNAFIKTVLMVALLYAIYAVPYWLFQTLLPPGWLRSLSFLLSFVLFDVLWGGAGRLLDRLLVGR